MNNQVTMTDRRCDFRSRLLAMREETTSSIAVDYIMVVEEHHGIDLWADVRGILPESVRKNVDRGYEELEAMNFRSPPVDFDPYRRRLVMLIEAGNTPSQALDYLELVVHDGQLDWWTEFIGDYKKNVIRRIRTVDLPPETLEGWEWPEP